MNFDEKEEQNMERKIIYLDDAIDALRYAQHRFTVADEAGGMGTVKWSEDVIYFATAERVLAELPSAQPEKRTEERTTTDYLLGNEQDSNDSDLEYNYIQRAIARNANRWSKKQKLDLVNALFENDD